MEKESGRTDHPSSSKGHDEKRKSDCSINAVERPQCNKEYGPGRVNLKASCITSAFSIPKESTRPRTVTDSKVSQMRFSRRLKRPIGRKIMMNRRVSSPKLKGRSTTFTVASTHMSQGGSRNS
jgi:hypothetical protein